MPAVGVVSFPLLMGTERTTPQNILACGADERRDDPPPTLFTRLMFKAANAVQIRVSIDEIEPGVWRRLVLPVH